MHKNSNALNTRGKKEITLKCPLCGSLEILFEAEKHSFSFERCNNCELVFSPQITPQFLSRLYIDGFHGPEEGAPKKGWSKNLRFLDTPLNFLAEKKNLYILDFGTGQSLIPNELRDMGHRVIALDIAPPLRPHPDRLTGDILQLQLPKNDFDLIFSFQVFEHLPEPKAILEKLLRLLRPSGLLLIHTDMETKERDEKGFANWWYATPPDHCIFYRHKTFQVFLNNQPAKLIWKDEKSVLIQKAGKDI